MIVCKDPFFPSPTHVISDIVALFLHAGIWSYGPQRENEGVCQGQESRWARTDFPWCALINTHTWLPIVRSIYWSGLLLADTLVVVHSSGCTPNRLLTMRARVCLWQKRNEHSRQDISQANRHEDGNLRAVENLTIVTAIADAGQALEVHVVVSQDTLIHFLVPRL